MSNVKTTTMIEGSRRAVVSAEQRDRDLKGPKWDSRNCERDCKKIKGQKQTPNNYKFINRCSVFNFAV